MAEEKKKKSVVDPYADPNFDPSADRGVKHPTTDFESFIHLIKGSLGSGVLAMPEAFMNMGTWAGIVMTIITTFIVGYCIHILVNSAHILYRRLKVSRLNYPEIAYHAFNDNPKVEKLASFMRAVVAGFLFTDLYGVCCIYMVLIGRAFKQVITYYLEYEISVRIWIVIFTIPLIFMCLVKSLKYIVPFSFIANCIVFYCVAATFTIILRDLPPFEDRYVISPIERMPLFFSTVIYAIENIGVIMSLENDMKTPEHMIGFPSVLSLALILILIVYSSLGFFGYWKYGEDTMGSISLNLPMNEKVAMSIKLGIGLAIFFTYTLQYYIPVNIAWSIVMKFIPENHHNWANYALRITMVIGASLIGSILPHLGPLISLCGAVCLSFLGLILPSMIELAVIHKFPGFGFLWWRLWKNIILIIFGFGVFVTGTYFSILGIQEEIRTGSYEE